MVNNLIFYQFRFYGVPTGVFFLYTHIYREKFTKHTIQYTSATY